jgi:hypothetical protein
VMTSVAKTVLIRTSGRLSHTEKFSPAGNTLEAHIRRVWLVE